MPTVCSTGREECREERKEGVRIERKEKVIKLVNRIIDEMGSSIARYKDVMDHLL